MNFNSSHHNSTFICWLKNCNTSTCEAALVRSEGSSAVTWKAYWSRRPLQEFSFPYSISDRRPLPTDCKSPWLRRNSNAVVFCVSFRFVFCFVKEQNSLWYLQKIKTIWWKSYNIVLSVYLPSVWIIHSLLKE